MSQLADRVVSAMADRAAKVAAGQPTDPSTDRLHELVSGRLRGSAIGARFLHNLATQPADPTARRDVGQAITAEAETDSEFAAELRRLANEVPDSPGLPAPSPDGSTAAAMVGHPPLSGAPRGLRPGPGVLLASVFAGLVLLLIASTVMVNVVWPRAGMTEGARIDRIEGSWSGRDAEGDRLSFTVHSDGAVFLDDIETRGCVSRMRSPARANYRLEVNCPLARVEFPLELNFSGSELTLINPEDGERVVLLRG